jgi:RNA polymerase sigma factor (sigma-70 family)
MAATTKADDFDAAALSDEELIRWTRRDAASALRELVARHYPRLKRDVTYWAKASRLPVLDREDALQQAVIVLLEAMRNYSASARGGRSRFAGYLHWLLRKRFCDGVRKLRRNERRINRSVQLEDLLARTGETRVEDDPAEQIIRIERHQCLDAALEDLEPRARRLWQMLESGRSLQTSAALLGLSYRQGKRLRQEMVKNVREFVSNWKP